MIAAVRPESFALSAVLLVAAAAALTAPALVLHLASAVAALALGLAIMLREKGTPSHRVRGRVWVALTSLAALSSFWLTGLREGFSVIHLLSAWTLVAMTLAIHFIRKGDVKRHKAFMVGTFLGLVGAGIGALAPGRALYRFFFGA
jgi:uncharacterized membrane protein